MLLKPILSLWPMVYPITERYYYIWKAAFYLLMFRVGSATNVLRLITVLISNIPLNPLFPLSLPRLVSLVLGIDLVEPPGVFLRQVIKSAAINPAKQTSA
jgi:hypothetical protein